MNWTDWLTLAIYFVFLIGLGLYFRGKNKNVSDYFRGGCQATWWMVGSSIFMSSFSAWTFTGAAGVAYEAGLSVAIIFLANATGFFIHFLFMGPWMRQLRAITAPEVIRDRFGPVTQQLIAYLSVPLFLLFAALALYGLAVFCSTIFGLPIIPVIVTVGIVVLFYASLGGVWGVLSTDFLQGLVLFPLTILMAALCLYKLGGLDGFLAAIHDQGLSSDFRIFKAPGEFPHNAYTHAWAAGIFIQMLIGYNTMDSAVRYFSVKDGRSARLAGMLACVLTLIGAAVWFIPPMTGRLIFAGQIDAMSIAKPAEASYALTSMALLPNGLTGLMMVAVFAATMSSMDTGLNKNAAIFTQDIYPALCRLFNKKPLENKARLLLGECFTVFLGIVIIGMALYFSQRNGAGMFEAMLSILTLLVLPMAVPTFLGFFFRKVPAYTAIVSMIGGLTVSTLSFFSETLGMEPWSTQKNVLWVSLSASVFFFACRLGWRGTSAAYREQVDRFFIRMHKPVNYAEEVGEDSDKSQLGVMGGISCILAGLIALTLLYPNPPANRLAILFLSAFIAAIGALMLWRSRVDSQ